MTTPEAKRLSRVYSRYAGSPRKRRAWAADNPGNIAIRRELIDQIEQSAGGRLTRGNLLDVGCGSAWFLRALVERGADPGRLHGVDLLERRIADARCRLPDSRFEVADARRLPFPDRSFDVVLMLTLLSSLAAASSVASALTEARRVLAPGGALLIYEPRVPNPLNRHTVFVSRRLLRTGLGEQPDEVKLTVLPALSRRLGPRTDRLYPRLARIGPLLTHRLSIHRASA
jgi:ubiquinone/menaquinone biosynthesis C-methylase UbiE